MIKSQFSILLLHLWKPQRRSIFEQSKSGCYGFTVVKGIRQIQPSIPEGDEMMNVLFQNYQYLFKKGLKKFQATPTKQDLSTLLGGFFFQNFRGEIPTFLYRTAPGMKQLRNVATSKKLQHNRLSFQVKEEHNRFLGGLFTTDG